MLPQFDDIRTELTQQLEDTRRELQLHKERLSEVEAENERKAGELRSALEEALASRQEVQAKASQVKQLQKQVDTLQMQVSMVIWKYNQYDCLSESVCNKFLF